MTLIVNTTQQVNTGLVVEPFGTDGAMHFVPIHGETPGKPFILDAAAVTALAAALRGKATAGPTAVKVAL